MSQLAAQLRDEINRYVPEDVRSTLLSIVDAVQENAPVDRIRELIARALRETDPYLLEEVQIPLYSIVITEDSNSVKLLSIAYLGEGKMRGVLRRLSPVSEDKMHVYSQAVLYQVDQRIVDLTFEEAVYLLACLPSHCILTVADRIATFYHLFIHRKREIARQVKAERVRREHPFYVV